MQVKIKNMFLNRTVEFLFNLSLKGKQSRHRSKLIKLLNARLEEVVDQEKELLKEHCHLDENGEPKKTDDGTKWAVKDMESFAVDKQELYNEEYIIEGGNNQLTLKTVRTILDECDLEFAGEEAVFYDYLCEVFHVDEDIEENNNTEKDDE